jgi:prephenate dehydrogenase
VTVGREEPPFRRIGIAGTGLIGGSIALAARVRWPEVHVSGTASRHAPLPDGLLDRTVDDIRALADECDLIVLGVPVPVMPRLMAQLAEANVVTDVGSTKRSVMAAAEAAGLPLFVGGHPMAGAERPGASEAREDLFMDRPWLLVEGTAPAETSARVESFARALGASTRWIDAEEHDRAVAYISHLPQVVAAALMNAADENVGTAGPQVSGNAFAEMTRLASSPAEMWRGICAENADFIAEALRAFLEQLPHDAGQTGEWIYQALTRSGEARTRWRAARGTSPIKP